VLGPDGVVTQVAAGAMSLALLADGTVWEWGAGWLMPVPVPGLTGVTKISAGSSFTGPVQVTGLTAATQVAAGGRGFSLAIHTVPYLVGL
jgi:alpha-tubulin suppressor-like RCC1 family protein